MEEPFKAMQTRWHPSCPLEQLAAKDARVGLQLRGVFAENVTLIGVDDLGVYYRRGGASRGGFSFSPWAAVAELDYEGNDDGAERTERWQEPGEQFGGW